MSKPKPKCYYGVIGCKVKHREYVERKPKRYNSVAIMVNSLSDKKFRKKWKNREKHRHIYDHCLYMGKILEPSRHRGCAKVCKCGKREH
jgi:hypothetical protein